MNRARKLGRLGLAITVMIASVVLSAAPARADGIVHYENVGNPGWCMQYGGLTLSLAPCGNGANQRWLWSVEPTGPLAGMIMLSTSEYPRVFCLSTDSQFFKAQLDYCNVTAANQHWDVWGQSGWVVYQMANTTWCLKPFRTDEVYSSYSIVLNTCPVRTNVPNIFAWRY
jgi:hypothetical protein